ncbi:MAG: hypothetical protein WC797_00070 [Candidatus Paceibacterota bacterium]|jgi:hypothetical protein
MTMAETTFVTFVFSLLVSFLYAVHRDKVENEGNVSVFTNNIYTTFCRLVVGLMLFNIFLVCRYDVGAITNSFALALAAVLCYEMRKLASPGYFCPSNPGDWAIASWEETKSFPCRLVIYLWGILVVSWYVVVSILCNFWTVGHLPLLLGCAVSGWISVVVLRSTQRTGNQIRDYEYLLSIAESDEDRSRYEDGLRTACFCLVKDAFKGAAVFAVVGVAGLGLGNIILDQQWCLELAGLIALALALSNILTVYDYEVGMVYVNSHGNLLRFLKDQMDVFWLALVLVFFSLGLWFEILTKIFVF